jgi:multiple sugar transport system substrate-binding protein
MFKGKWSTSVLALTMAAGMVLTGCGGEEKTSSSASSSSDEQVKISFWDDNAGPQRTPIWEEIIKRFEEEHPTIDVEYVGLPKDSSKAKLDAAIAADDMPDVANVYASWLPEFHLRGALLPLDSYYEEWSEKEKINQGSIDFNRSLVGDGKLYGVPYTQNLDILWIRSDWFEEANVKTPETWDEFFSASEQLTDKANNRYGYTIRGGAGGSMQLQRMMYAYSGIKDYIKDGKATVNDPKHAEFLKKYFALYKTNTPQSDITNDYKSMIATFDSGGAAMVQHNIGSFAEHEEAFEPDQFEAIPLPQSLDGHYAAEGGNTIGVSIFKDTEHPDEAWEFVSFVNSKEAQSYWNEAVGQIPTNGDVLDEEWVKEASHIQTAAKVYDEQDTVLYEPPFYLPEYSSILNNLVDPGIQSVLSGQKTVEEFLDEWAKAIEESEKKFTEHFKK